MELITLKMSKTKWWIVISVVVLVYWLTNTLKNDDQTLNSDSNPVHTTSYDNKESAEHDIQSDPVEAINKNNEQSQKNENPENQKINNSSNNEDEISQPRLNGRGRSDDGREEPQYVGLNGYAAASSSDVSRASEFQEKFPSDPWEISKYKQVGDNKFDDSGKTTKHKTEVTVIKQFLTHKGFGTYEGALLVQEISTKNEYYINVYNFVTYPYWEDNIEGAVKEGPLLAVYNGKGTKPADRQGTWVDLPKGSKVIADSIESVGTNKGKVRAEVYKEWDQGFGGVDIYFDVNSLDIYY